VFGELVKGDDVLKTIEAAGSRSGRTNGEIKIVNCGDVVVEEE